MIKEAGEVFLWDPELCSAKRDLEKFRHWAQTAQTATNGERTLNCPCSGHMSHSNRRQLTCMGLKMTDHRVESVRREVANKLTGFVLVMIVC
jgi:hypothetical protein